LVVTAKPNRQRISGRFYSGLRFTLLLPSNITDKIRLCYVTAWMIARSKGLSGRDIAGLSRYHALPNTASYYGWATALPLDKKPERTINKGDKLERQWRNAQKMIKTWERKLKLAQTKVRNWKRAEKTLHPHMIAAKLLGE
jgi:hypothetical protein